MSPIVLNVMPSRVLIGALCAVHVLLSVSFFALHLPWWAFILLSFGVGLHLIWQVWRYYYRPRVWQVGVASDGCWWQGVQKVRARILPSAVVTRWFIALHLAAITDEKPLKNAGYPARRVFVWLFVWQYPTEEYRCLARWLRVLPESAK